MKGKILTTLILVVLHVDSLSQINQLKKLTIDSKNGFEFANEGKKVLVEAFSSFYDSINCSLMVVDNESKKFLEFDSAVLKNDTLDLTFFNYDPPYDIHVCNFKICASKYQANYEHLSVMDQIFVDKQIQILDSKLTVNSNDFKKGGKIRGLVELKILCNSGCSESERPRQFSIKGNFRAYIK